MRISRFISRLLCAAILLLPITAIAQPLVDRVPADAVIYIGWRGAEGLGSAGYESSHLKAVVDGSNLKQLFTDFLPKLTARIGRDEPQAAEALQLATAIGGALWRHPSAIYFGGVDLSNPQQPMPKLAIICDAGADAPALLAKLNDAIAKMGKTPIPLMAVADDKTIILSTIGLTKKPASALPTNKAFTDAMGKLQKEPVAAFYLDGANLMQMVGQIIEASGNKDAAARWPTIRDALGLGGLKGIACTETFEGQDWATQMLISAPAPRTGLLALMDGKPISNDLLKTIPKNATIVGASSFDVSKLLSEIKTAAAKIDPQAEDIYNKAMAGASAFIGANVQTDVIDPLGDQWAFYCAPDIGGNGFLGVTLVNKLDDPAKAQRGLGAVEIMTNNMVAGQLKKKDDPKIAFRTFKSDGMTVHYLATPFISPAWAIKDGNLYVSLFPQVVISASNHVATSRPSIIENESFAALRARLGGEEAHGIQFLDLPRVAGEGYASVVAMTRLGLGAADMIGVPAPAMIIPPLDKLMPHLTPSGAVSKVDDAGLFYRSVSPFPGSSAFASTQGQVMAAPLMLSILLPSLNRARETANRVKCGSNMRQLGLAIQLHANEHKGEYPPDLGAFLKYIPPLDLYVCPDSNMQIPQAIRNGTAEQKAAWLEENSSYVYVGAGMKNNASAEEVVLYEKPGNHGNDGMNLLYADGHVVWLGLPAANLEIQKAQQRQHPGGRL